ncbi:hypothetical protein EJ104_09505, partial [Deinococcus radiophilus]
ALLQPLGSSQAPLLKLGTRILVRLPFHGPWSLAAHTCAAINSNPVRRNAVVSEPTIAWQTHRGLSALPYTSPGIKVAASSQRNIR